MTEKLENVTEEQAEAMADETALVAAGNDWLHPLEPYAPRAALKELAYRIRVMDTSLVPLNVPEAMMLAQQSATAQLNPFMGEIWAWVTVRDNKRMLTIMPGRRGILRHARDQAKEQDMKFWEEYSRITNAEERLELNIPEGALAYECTVRDDVTMAAWGNTYDKLKGLGLTEAKIFKEIGHVPVAVGIGVIKKAEMDALDRGKNKMPHAERCKKRAYMSALKKKFDLPFGAVRGIESGLTFDDYIRSDSRLDAVDAEFKEVKDVRPEDAPTDDKEVAKRRKAQWWPPGICDAVVEAGLSDNAFSAAAILAWSPFDKSNAKPDVCMDWVRFYRGVQEEGKYKTAKEVAEVATLRYFDLEGEKEAE